MYAPLSSDEREALSRFLAKLVEDADKLATLLESRGIESCLPRQACSNLARTLELLQNGDMEPAARPAFRPSPDIGYNRLS